MCYIKKKKWRKRLPRRSGRSDHLTKHKTTGWDNRDYPTPPHHANRHDTKDITAMASKPSTPLPRDARLKLKLVEITSFYPRQIAVVASKAHYYKAGSGLYIKQIHVVTASPFGPCPADKRLIHTAQLRPINLCACNEAHLKATLDKFVACGAISKAERLATLRLRARQWKEAHKHIRKINVYIEDRQRANIGKGRLLAEHLRLVG